MDLKHDRKTFIGGSDIAAVMGMSRWDSPLRVWAEKTGKVPQKDLSDVEAVEIGTELEEYVAKKFTKRTGFKTRRDTRDFTHPKYPYMRAHIDRWILGEDALLECKTTSAWREKEWRGEDMPREFILQVTWYLGIVGKSVGYCAVLIGGQKFDWKEIKFDPVLFEKMVEVARDFWENYVLADRAPLAGELDGDTLDELFPGSDDESVLQFEGEQAERLNALVEERQGGIEAIDLAKKEVESISNQIKQVLGEKVFAETGTYGISHKEQGRTLADADKMKEDGIFEKYAKTTKFKVLRTRKLPIQLEATK